MGGLNSESTVIDEMRSVFSAVYRAIDRLREIEVEIGMGDNSSADEYQQLSSWLEANDGYNVDVKIRMILNGMGFSEDELFRNISGFSGGEENTSLHLKASSGRTESAYPRRTDKPPRLQDHYVA